VLTFSADLSDYGLRLPNNFGHIGENAPNPSVITDTPDLGMIGIFGQRIQSHGQMDLSKIAHHKSRYVERPPFRADRWHSVRA
jgi:hypothetical protein